MENRGRVSGVGEEDVSYPAPGLSSPSPSSDLRILLWDIDGTLIRSARAGAFKEYTVPVLESVFGTAGRLPELSVSGMTDLQIVAESLRDEGFTQAEIRARLGELTRLYLSALRRAAGAEGPPLFETLPGVRAALERVAAHPRYFSALLTGNIAPAARLKLRLMGLADFFKLPGAFGNDSHDRRDLPAIAHERLGRHLNLHLRPAQLIVIGDTPNDIACARHYGCRAVGVGTGRVNNVETLRPHLPDALLPDLSDTDRFMQTLAGL